MSKATIVILGGGFAGVKCAKTLRKLLPKEQYRLVVFNRENHMVFHPLLAEVASAAIQTKHVAAPLRQLLHGVKCRTEEVINVDLDKNFIEYEAYDRTRRQMFYDHLVIACGNRANFGIVPGMDEQAFPLKNVGDALKLQAHIIDMMEKAEVCDDPRKRDWYLTFTVIGGGFSGVEVAGEINEFVRKSSKFFETLTGDMITVNLIHSGQQILPEVNSSLRDFAQREMEKHGVKFHLGVRAVQASREGVTLDSGALIPSATIVCTIGTTPHPLVARLPVENIKGRIATTKDMNVPGFRNVWAIGDCAAVPNEASGQLSPPVAQFAERQGVQLAHNIVNSINGKPTKPFSHVSQGSLCAIGGHNAVAEIQGMLFSGFIAWFMWRAIYLFKLPSLVQRIKVGIEWFCDLVFPRDLVYVKTDTSRAVSRAFYGAGDYIFKQGDPATDFFVIEMGDVEVLAYNQETGTEEVVAVLGPGDFFGEAALVTSRSRNASVRARSNVLVVTMGRSLFTEMSANLGPLRDAIAKAVRRRRNVWKDLPDVRKVLDTLSLEDVMEPVPGEVLRTDYFLDGILELFCQHRLDFCCVLDASDKVVGVVTRSDLLRTIEAASTFEVGQDDVVRVHHIMGHEPIVIKRGEGTACAVNTMREHGLKNLPVVDENDHLVGCVRIETILSHVVTELSRRRAIRVTQEHIRPTV
ncbi:FAD-dependent oxidoreductase [Candidatus Obscuribacterales bacterium]|nr:FAD-dependent oxidoreductase [Candidatus Obscuribacterales bacterium]MBX3149566.1 FAD-dependent oxidoreductase [Candidatus Obscuribacterales bacterium]